LTTTIKDGLRDTDHSIRDAADNNFRPAEKTREP